MGVVKDWEATTVLRNLAKFSSDVVEQFGIFVLRNEKQDGFGDLCNRMEELFSNLSDPKKTFLSLSSEYGTLQYSQSSEAMTCIYYAVVPPRKEKDVRKAWEEFTSLIRRIRDATDVSEVEDHVRAVRNAFYKISRKCREHLRTEEKVIALHA